MFGTSEKCNILFFPLLFIKFFLLSLFNLFPFNWSLWLFVVGMAALGLCESVLYRLLTGNKRPSLNQRYWISRLYVKNGYFWRESVDHFVTKQAELLAV